MKTDTLLVAVSLVCIIALASSLVILNDDCDCEYLYTDEGYVVTGLKSGYDKTFVIPEEHDNLTVVGIADRAFMGSDVEYIFIPKSIKTIGTDAFSDCKNLKAIYYDDTLLLKVNGEYVKGFDSVILDEGAFNGYGVTEVVIENSSDNDTLAKATFRNVPVCYDKVSINASLNTYTDRVSKNTVVITDHGSQSTLVDLGTYGLFEDIELRFDSQNDKMDCSVFFGGISVTADHYSFALLNATYPVLLFSLELCDNGVDHPLFVHLERYGAYNWNALPDNVYAMPFLRMMDVENGEVGFHGARPGIANYIKELYELDNGSKFTLYCVDNYPELILEFLVGNGIPESQWNTHLLTDGTNTATQLNRTFNVADPDARYDLMAEEWHELLDAVYENGYSETIIREYLSLVDPVPYSLLHKYPFIITKEQDNVDWTTGRLRPTENLTPISPDFVAKIRANVRELYTNNLLAALDDGGTARFQELYHFDDQEFTDAREDGKRIMMILGAAGSVENIVNEGVGGDLYSYLKMTMEYYGDGYAYFYKGHPGWPTSMYPNRQIVFDTLRSEGYSLVELDNSIAAEVFMFYNPDIYLSGFASTTFQSAPDPSMSCALYNMAKGAGDDGYEDDIDVFFTKLSGTSYQNIDLDPQKRYYLMQFNNDAGEPSQSVEYEKHEICIYNSTDNLFNYYKLNGNVYELV